MQLAAASAAAERPRRHPLAACCDPALDGLVLLLFGGAEHDWAAVELGAWVAQAERAPLRLVGATAVPERAKRDASRLLSHAALAIQRLLGIAAEPVPAAPGEEGILDASSRDARLLVVGLSTRWHEEGLGPARLRLAESRRPAHAARPPWPPPGRNGPAGGELAGDPGD